MAVPLDVALSVSTGTRGERLFDPRGYIVIADYAQLCLSVQVCSCGVIVSQSAWRLSWPWVCRIGHVVARQDTRPCRDPLPEVNASLRSV